MLGAPDPIGSREAYCYISLTSQDFGLAKCKLAWYNRSVGEVMASTCLNFTGYMLWKHQTESASRLFKVFTVTATEFTPLFISVIAAQLIGCGCKPKTQKMHLEFG